MSIIPSRSSSGTSKGESASVVDSEAPLLEVRGLKKYYQNSTGLIDRLIGNVEHVRAVDDVNLRIQEKETVAIVGESGCGKSTLAKTILNLHTPTEGAIRFRGTDIAGLSDKQMRTYRQKLQIVFQDPLASLNPRQTVGEIIKSPLDVHGIGDSDEDRINRVKELLQTVGLNPTHSGRYPHQFSGGQQQRIGIARAISMDPDLIIADEPVSALDVSVQAQILDLLENLQEKFGLSILFIAHDLSVVRMIADRVAVMYLGEIVEKGSSESLFQTPQHPYTRSLLTAVPRIDPSSRPERVTLTGAVPSPLDPPSGCRFHTRCPVIIPPENWTGSQQSFRAVATFTNRILNDDIDPSIIREDFDAGRGDYDEIDMETVIAQSAPSVNLDSLPNDARNSIEDALSALLSNNTDTAKRILTENFQSPCKRDNPELADIDDEHYTSCFRMTEESYEDIRMIW